MTVKLPERKLPAAPEKSLPDGESVSQYLFDHPDFFEKRPDLLNNLRLPHAERGSTISLVERQVQNLRSDSKELNQKLQALLNVARENDHLAERLHHFTLTLLKCNSLAEVLSAIKTGLVDDFGIEQVVLKFDLDDPANKNYKKLALDDFEKQQDSKDIETSALIEKIFTKDAAPAPVCFNNADKGYFHALFDMKTDVIYSSIVLPLGKKTITGLLALGSHDKQRFQPGMSTMYLTRLSDLINVVLVSHAR